MIKIEKKEDIIDITVEHYKYTMKMKFFAVLGIAIFSMAVIMFVNPFVLKIIAQIYILIIFGLQYYSFRKNNIEIEKLIIKKNFLILENIGSDKKIIFSKRLNYFEIEEIFFKDSFGAYFSSRGGEGSKKYRSKRSFLKIKTTSKEIFSFGFLIKIEDYRKIKKVFQELEITRSIKFSN